MTDWPVDGAPATGSVPPGRRLPYDGVSRDVDGRPLHYHVRTQDGTTGWVPASGVREDRTLYGRSLILKGGRAQTIYP